MSELNESPVFVLSKDEKKETLKVLRDGIQQLLWQVEYVKKQYNELPELPEDAPKELTQERAKRRVQIDAMEKKVEDQIEFYNFCKSTI